MKPPRCLPILALLLTGWAAAQPAEPVQGRYVYYGNALSNILGVAEFEVWSGGRNVLAKRADAFTLHCLTDTSPEQVAAHFRNIVDGNTNTLQRWPGTLELHAIGMGYQDGSLSYCAFEADLGQTLPVERIELYRSRYAQEGRPFKLFGDLGWRYLLVLDEQRRIVAWNAFNVYQGDIMKQQGYWSFVPQPATGAPAGRVVPLNSRSWLTEAEFIRDFLGKPVIDRGAQLGEADKARLATFGKRNKPDSIRALGQTFFRRVDLDRPELATVKALVEKELYAEALEAFKAPFFAQLAILDQVYGKFEYSWYCDLDSRDGMRARDLDSHLYASKDALTVTCFIPGLLPPAKLDFPFQTRPLLLAYVATGDAKYLRGWEALNDDWALGYQAAADADPKNLRDTFVLVGGPVMANLQDWLNASRQRPEFVREVSGASLARFLLPILEEMPVALWRVTRKCVFNHVFNAVTGGWGMGQALGQFRAGERLEDEMRQLMQRMYVLGLYRDGPMIEIGDEGHLPGVATSPAALYGRLAMSPEIRPAWFTPAFEAFYLDHLRRSVFAIVSHVAPDGVGIRTAPRHDLFLSAIGGRGDFSRLDKPDDYPDLAGLLLRLSAMLEPEPRAVVDSVYGWGPAAVCLPSAQRRDNVVRYVENRLHRQPEFVSDVLPYAGCWYFRGGWQREDAFLHMLKQPLRNSLGVGGMWDPCLGHLGYDLFVTTPTAYRFRDYATPLVTVLATQLDKQRPCDVEGYLFSGSKQDAFTQGVEKPAPNRWFSDHRLDFGEASFQGRYNNLYFYPLQDRRRPKEAPVHARDPQAVTGVTTTRQLIQVRPARMFLQLERIRYASPEESHSNRLPLNLILTEPAPDSGKPFSDAQLQIDAKARTVKARNPGNPGLTLAWFGQPGLTFTPCSVNGAEYNYFPWPDPEIVDPKRDAMLNSDIQGKLFETLNGPRRTSGRGVFATWTATGSTLLLGALYANKPGEEPVRKLSDLSTDSVAGLQAVTTKGLSVTLLAARSIPALLTIGDLASDGEALLVVEAPKQPRTVMVLGARRFASAGKELALASPDQVFDLPPAVPATSVPAAPGNVAAVLPPLAPPTIGPAEATFTDTATITLASATPGAVIKYSTAVPASRLDEFRRVTELVNAGKLSVAAAAERLAVPPDNGENWQVYTGPFTVGADTFVRARSFRRGDEIVPALRAAGTAVSAVSYAFFTRRPLKPALAAAPPGLRPGLAWDYLEDRWFALWTYADLLPPKAIGSTARLLDVSMRRTDQPFGVRYHGYLDIPADGVYSFYGPDEYINNTCEPGYDLRVYLDGEQWDLAQTWHGRGRWALPLAKGLHRFLVTFADARAKDLEHQRVDLWRGYPDPATTWRGVAPTLEVSGPGLPRQPLPDAWLRHARPAYPIADYAAMTTQPETTIYKTVGDRSLKLLVMRPEGAAKDARLPALVWIHGGGWRSGSPERFLPHMRYTVARGAVAFAIQYRLLDGQTPGLTIADCVADCAAAMRHIRAHAKEFGIDPQRLSVLGDSAGGHLALCLGVLPLPPDATANAVVDCNGITDFVEGKWRRDYGLGDDAAARAISPLRHLRPGLPPIAVLHGGRDTVVPPADAEAFYRACRREGLDAEYICWPDASHAFILTNYTATDAQVTRALLAADAFLSQRGLLDGPPALATQGVLR